jgi:hypothetical protein
VPHFTQTAHECPHATTRRASLLFRGCTIDPEPITAAEAASRLGKDPATIRSWGSRYQARKLGRIERRTYFDWNDLATIDGCMARGEEVPTTAEGRDQLRADLRARWQHAA